MPENAQKIPKKPAIFYTTYFEVKVDTCKISEKYWVTL